MRSTQRSARTALAAAAALAGALALGVPASDARASGFTIGVTGPSTGTVGKPMVLRANGTIPLDRLQFPYWLSVDLLSTKVVRACPADSFAGHQFANSTGGAVLVFTQREAADSTGAFSSPFGLTPLRRGRYLICAYTSDGSANTFAVGPKTLSVKAKRRAKSRRRRLRRAAASGERVVVEVEARAAPHRLERRRGPERHVAVVVEVVAVRGRAAALEEDLAVAAAEHLLEVAVVGLRA